MRDRKGEPRTARVAGRLALGIYLFVLTVWTFHGLESGWIALVIAVGGVLKLVEWALLDEHRTRIAAGATEEEWAKKYRGR